MTTATQAKKLILTEVLGFLNAIKNDEIDGTERRQMLRAGRDASDILGYTDIGDALINYSHSGELDDDTDLDSLILATEHHLKFADDAA